MWHKSFFTTLIYIVLLVWCAVFDWNTNVQVLRQSLLPDDTMRDVTTSNTAGVVKKKIKRLAAGLSDYAARNSTTSRAAAFENFFHDSTASCPNYGYTKGHWVKTNLDRGEKWTADDNGRQRYRWQVDDYENCQLDPFELITNETFCEALQGRSILLAGDSMNELMFEHLKELLWDGSEFHRQMYYIKDMKLDLQVRTYLNGICGSNKQQQRIAWYRNYHLTTNKWLEGEELDAQQHQPWLADINKYQVLILNTGAHVEWKDALEKHREKLELVKTGLKEMNYKGTVLWRTTPRGHVGCTVNDTEAILSETDDNNWDRFFPPKNEEDLKYYQRWRYGMIPEQNKIDREFFQSHQILDVERMTELRPDGHLNPEGRDCLHYDTRHEVLRAWVWLLQNALKGKL